MSGYDAPPPGPPGPPASPPPYPGYPSYPANPAYAPLTVLPLENAEYHEIHRTSRRPEWWRAAVGLLVALLGFFAVQIVITVAFVVALLVDGRSSKAALDTLTGVDDATPAYLAFLFLNLAALIPVAILVTRFIHGLRPGWVVSVVGRVRWRWLLTCFGLAFAALTLTVIVSLFLPAGTEAAEVGTEVNAWTTTLRDFLIVVVLLTPLQAAGEEFAFRGYLTQGVGGLVSRWSPQAGRIAAVAIPAVIFALLHGPQDAPIFVDRLAFGLVAGVLVIATGGLEAGIAMHILNNYLAFGFALAFGDMSSALRPTGGSWWQLPQTLTQSIAYLALAIWMARRMGIATRTAPVPTPQELERPEPRV